MSDYRTEIVVPSDRYVCLQLPGRFPTGHAIVTVRCLAPAADLPEAGAAPEEQPDRIDIEWWEEFDEEVPPPASPRGAS